MGENNCKKILIVDDDEEIQTLYGLYLRGESFQIVRALNGKEALDVLAQEKPDLIVLDMIMPVMDGEEFLLKLRLEKQDKNTPVIIASVNDKIPQKLLDVGNIFAVLKKPFTMDALLGKIRECLQNQSRD